MKARIDAVDWMLRIEAGDADPEALKAWLEEGSGRREALDRARRLWADLNWDATLNSDALASAGRPQTTPSGGLVRRLSAWAARPGLLPAGAGLAAAAAVVFALAVWNPGGPVEIGQPARMVHETQVGEIRSVSLPDGSSMVLGGLTSAAERYSETGRLVDLADGDALFRVSRDDSRAFIVNAGPLTVEVLGTVFEINRARSRVQVSVMEGVVRAQAAEGAAIELGAGDRLVMEAGGEMRRERFEPGAAARWREARLVYRDAPLGRIIDDINRYHTPAVTLESRDLAVLRVTTSFRIDQLEAALSGIALSHGLEIGVGEDGALSLRHP